MSERLRKLLLAAGLLLLLGGVNYTIWARERLLASGESLLLELAPVDPRSLIQGDYMALNFRAAVDLMQGDESRPSQGKLVLRRGADGVATFVRLHGDEPLAADERLLDYRVRDGRVRIVTNAYFFEERQAERFMAARYGELRVLPSGEALLTGMRDQTLQPIRP
jgi:uncharacterized membrane-anchored protein